jgi:hypothetical protein
MPFAGGHAPTSRRAAAAKTLLALLCLVFPPVHGLAGTVRSGEKALSGEDAAYIDWGVKNCGAKSTDKEHALVEQATTKDHDGFTRHYLARYQSQTLVDALASASRQEGMCTDIKAWYGPQGSRLTDLITWDRATASPTDKQGGGTPVAGKGRRQRANPGPGSSP